MRIISKYKDFYDYYQGIFGIDNSKIYNRKDVVQLENVHSTIDDKETTVIDFAISGIRYRSLCYRNKLYHTPTELKELDLLLKKNTSKFGGIQFTNWRYKYGKKDKYLLEYNDNNNVKTTINHEKREPVLVSLSRYNKNWDVPLLKTFDFHKIMDAKELYIKVETFLGWLVDNPPLPDKQTNVGKIVSHGFDKKTSFRPNMKIKS